MKIVKRNGDVVDFNPTKILNRIKKQTENLKVNADDIFIKVSASLANDMSTKELDELISRTSESMSYKHPDYSILSGRIFMSRLHKETEDNYYKSVKRMNDLGIINDTFYNIVKENKDIIQANIDYSKDFSFDYFACSRLKEIYLIKDGNNIIERPQQMFMRVALNTNSNIDEAIEYYKELSLHGISPATPIMINAGTNVGQLASCNLSTLKGDDTEGLLKSFNNVCVSSSKAEGIGLAGHVLRSKKSFVGKEGGLAGGLLKYLKIVNEGLRFWNQRGKRPGSAAIYLAPYHKDIFDLLEIRLPNGKEESRARDLFFSLWIPDNFMRAVKNNEDYYLFCPNDVKKAGLKAFHTLYGEEFEAEYQKGIELGLGEKIKAREIWNKVLESQIETGLPYICFSDNANKKTNHQNIGTLTTSNLCSEIFQYVDADETAICMLSSLPLQKCVVLKDGKLVYDFDLLAKRVRLVVRSLNKVIDINNYSTEEGRRGALRQRALGIGVQGLADTFALLKYNFISEESKQLNKDIFETIYYSALKASNELAREKNETYYYYENSPVSKGILQYDMWGLTESDLSGRWDWKALKEDIKLYGVMNSLVTTCPPTASSASILGSNEAFEPFNSNLYLRNVAGGEYSILNKHLVRDLEEEGIWNDYLANELVARNGVISEIGVIPDEIKERYKTVYELSQSKLIEMSADRAVFIDQSQSLNIFMDNPTIGKLTSSHFKAWELGLKTGMYYLRSKPVENKAKHLGVVVNKEVVVNSNSSDFSCDGCSA